MNILNIELKGYGKAGQKVCNNCPCADWQDWADDTCRLGYWQYDSKQRMGEGIYDGRANVETGEVVIVKDDRYDGKAGWIGAHIRPQICIDNHGE